MTQQEDTFQLSRFGIKAKLISIISTLMLVALGGMIFFTSAFFSDESELRIQENNLDLAQASGQWMESELINFSNQSSLMAENLLRGAAKRDSIDKFFKKNPEFIYLAASTNSGRSFSREIYHADLMDSVGLSKSHIAKLKKTNQKHIQGSSKGQLTIFNASNGNQVLMGISQKVGDVLFLLYMDPSPIQKYFKARKYIDIYMVNQTGDVIVHPDSRTVLSNTSFSKKEIIKEMWQSRVSTGQSRFTDDVDDKVYLASYKKLNIATLGLVVQAQEDIVFEPVRRIQNRNLMIMGVFLALSIGIVYLFAKFMTGPVTSLVDATHKIEGGNYNIEIAASTKDEIGLLAHSFQNMATGLGEKEKIKDAFGRFVNKEIAEKVLKGQVNLGGEKKLAAIFFSDLRGFTAMSEKMQPEEVVEFLNEYFTDMVRCVDETGGIVDKYIGDAIMAHWGALGGEGNETENAVNTALLMREAMIEFNKRGEGKRPPAFMGSGINTGEVISGQIGSQDRLEYTVIGDAVNLASRTEGMNKILGTDILISSLSYERVKDIFHVETMPAIKVKGKSEPQHIYAVLGRKDDPDSPRNIGAVRTMLGIKYDESMARSKGEKVEII